MVSSTRARTRAYGYSLAARLPNCGAFVTSACTVQEQSARARIASTSFLRRFVEREGVPAWAMHTITPRLIERSYDLDPRVRAHALRALQAYDRYAEQVEEALHDAKKDPDPQVRRALRRQR